MTEPAYKPDRILYGVQDHTGRAVVEAIDRRRLSVHREESRIQLRYGDEVVSEGYAPPEADLTLHTWDADAKVDTDGEAAGPLTSRPIPPPKVGA